MYDKITKMLVEGDTKDETLNETLNDIAIILKEAAEAKEVDGMSYLLKFEEFLDDCGIYSFKGWEDAVVVKEPVIGKYWVTLELILPKNCDLDAGLNIAGKDNDTKVSIKRSEHEENYIARIKVLRNKLDEIEVRNRKEAEKESAEVKNYPMQQPNPNQPMV